VHSVRPANALQNCKKNWCLAKATDRPSRLMKLNHVVRSCIYNKNRSKVGVTKMNLAHKQRQQLARVSFWTVTYDPLKRTT